MSLVLSCDDPHLPEDLGTDICGTGVVRWALTSLLGGLLLGAQIYLRGRWKFRCHKTLLTYHNLRSALVLLMLAVNSLELARALLPLPPHYSGSAYNSNNNPNGRGNYVNNGSGYGSNTADAGGGSALNLSFPGFARHHLPLQLQQPQQQQKHSPPYKLQQQGQPLYQQQEEEPPPVYQELPAGSEVVVVVGSSALLNAVLAIVFTLVLMSFHRTVELKNAIEFLYASAVVEFLLSMLRVYELAEITYDRSWLELEPCLQASNAVCLLSLCVADGATIYKERFRPVYVEDHEKIGYKHSLATFYSKACFWWLTPLLWLGYKEPLEPEDLGRLRVEDRARAYYDRFLLIYKTANVPEADPPPSLWLCYVLSSWRMFALGGALKLLGDLCALIGPLAIQQIVQYIEALYAAAPGMQQQQQQHQQGQQLPGPPAGLQRSLRSTGSITSINPYNNYNDNGVVSGNLVYDAPRWALGGADVRIYFAAWSDLVANGWAVAWIVLLAALAQGGLSQASTHILNMTGIRIKTSLQGLIYRKTLLLSASCIDQGGDNGDQGSGSPSNGEGLKAAKDPESSAKSGPENRSPASDAGSTDVGAITNLMTEDTLNVMYFFWIAHYVWAIPLKIGVVMYLLYLKLGVSAVIGSFVCILTLTPLQFLIGKAMPDNSEKVAKFTDERLRKIHDTFCGIKLIKLNAWDDVFLKKIRAARRQELRYLNKDSVYWTLMTILTHVSSVLISFVTLGVFVRLEGGGDFGSQFTASRLFSALALFQQLTVPLLIFPITVPIIISAVVSTRRLDRFLRCPEVKKEFQGIRNMARILCRSDASLDMYERQAAAPATTTKTTTITTTTTAPEGPPSPDPCEAQENALNERLSRRAAPLAVSEPQSPVRSWDAPPVFALQPSSPSPPASPEPAQPPLAPSVALLAPPRPDADDCSDCKRRVLLRNTPYVLIRPPSVRLPNVSRSLSHQLRGRYRDSLLLKMPEGVAVSLRQASFAWDRRRMERLLSVGSIDVPKGRLTVVVGKNGSGKSSLLAALLMEMPHVSGDLIWDKTSTFAYVPQQPWLLNASIRENILFGEDFRPKRYEFVLEACALRPDVDLMPERDLAVIGERGLNLSGGQRQRVAIARALYSSANVVLMDDPLSSLDNEVARHIFEQSIRGMLLKANRTVILVTQQLSLVRQADYLVVMKDGRVQAAGSYADIEDEHPEIAKTWTAIVARAQEKEQQSSAAGRTARERWKLFKNVSKLGLMRSVSLTSAASSVDAAAAAAATADEAAADSDILPATLPRTAHAQPFALARKRSSVYGSRHLIYDVPLPIDECGADDVIFRRQPPRRRRRTVSSRSSSGSSDFRRSLLTASCSSAASSVTAAGHNNNGTSQGGEGGGPATTASDVGRPERAQSWQAPNRCLHEKAPRNATSTPASASFEDASAAATADLEDLAEERRLQGMGSFQQFLRRMSSRRSNLTKATRLHHRPLSATNSILSISEESTTTQPSIELASVATETSSWMASIEDEEPVSGALVDCQDSLRPPLAPTRLQLENKANGWAPPSPLTPSDPGADVERKYGKIPAQIYLLYLRASGYPMVLAFCATALVLQGLRVYTDVWLQRWTDDVGQGGDPAIAGSAGGRVEGAAGAAGAGHEVTYYFHVYAAISCVCILMALLSTPAGQMAGCNARRNLHDQLLSAIMRKSLHFFQVTPLGRIMNRFGNDMAIIDKKIAATSQRLLQFTLLCLCAVLINVGITPWFVLLTLPICAAYYAIQKFYRCSSRELQRIENATNTPLISHLSETIQGVTTIRAYNQEARFTEILFRRLEANTIAFTILNTSNRWLGISLDYLGGVIVFVAIVTALLAATISCRNSAASYGPQSSSNYNNSSSGASSPTPAPSPSLVGLAINYTLLVPIYLNWVVKLLADMEMYVGSVERIAYYAEPPPPPSAGHAPPLGASNEPRPQAADSTATTHATPVAVHLGDGDDDDEDEAGGDPAAPAVDGPGSAVDADAEADVDADVADGDDGADGIEKFAGADKTAVDNADAAVAAKAAAAAAAGAGRRPKRSRRQRNEAERRASVRRLVDGVRYKTVPISWPQRGDISFERVSLRYEGRPKDVIADLTLRIPAGQRIGICGRTGSGKSSLALSLFGVLQTTAGRILIDDVDITQVHPDEVRSRLSIIPQDVHLFNATVRENLDPPGYYSDLALWNCLEVAQLKEFVSNAMPQGLDTEILDGGANLSAGHRQLFCLARAILRGSVCLVLDEATSSLDSSTEQQLLDTAHRAFQGRTILTIAHRLSTILDYDRIIVLEQGRVVEDGSPQELQRRPGGVFHALFHSGRPLSVGSDSGLLEYMRVQEDVREEEDLEQDQDAVAVADADDDSDNHNRNHDVGVRRRPAAEAEVAAEAEAEAKAAGHGLS